MLSDESKKKLLFEINSQMKLNSTNYEHVRRHREINWTSRLEVSVYTAAYGMQTKEIEGETKNEIKKHRQEPNASR